jgi:putative phosphoribosyl transferase
VALPVLEIAIMERIAAPLFRDRAEAGRHLAERLRGVVSNSAIVLGLPRGGVPAAFEVARALHLELDIFLVRKLGLPGQEQLAVGAIASGGIRVLNRDLIYQLSIPPDIVNRIAEREHTELERSERACRGDRPPASVHDREVVLVDDGLATGATMRVAIKALKMEHAARIIVAIPLAPTDTCKALRLEVDLVVCLASPEPFVAVGCWYEDFSQTTDADVRSLLEQGTQVTTA